MFNQILGMNPTKSCMLWRFMALFISLYSLVKLEFDESPFRIETTRNTFYVDEWLIKKQSHLLTSNWCR